MDIIFLDNGLIGRGEHSYSLVKKVGEALAARGHCVRAFGMRSMDPAIVAEIGAIPHFRVSLYESESPTPNERRLLRLAAFLRRRPFDPAIPSERTSAKTLNASFREDLAALPADVLRRENLVVVPGLSQNQLLGLVRALRALPEGQRPRVVCQLMFAPDWTPWGRKARLGPKLYRKAFTLARPLIGRSLFFTAENAAIAGLYRELYAIDAKILPVPFGEALGAAPVADRPAFGFFGYSKCDKGFHLLPEAIELCRAKNLAADFVVQLQHGGWEPATVAAEQALRAQGGVRLVEGVLTEADYAAETGKIDAMLLPYDPLLFGLRGSGIFTQSVAAGRPVVAALGTFAAASIASGEAEGEIFAPYDAPALAAAIMRLAARLPESHARAARLARSFGDTHSAGAYADVLLAHAEGL
ncbi:hypothetical protein Msil_0807 [Methylocella silvestris BL2]|uniref:Glycosyl transferase group 1 n=1 Tax=Methylocella silvestris (strain DSM 15510 / CIP 108128 / LMG 27833 / NCIMB 13906 / BL2) TaxID=395965 RepID=B8ER32_METSB|nr:glycosyltransferase [Methylocella silvestris]ACK49777.1 hypothetical protein Msil_0807 [Methylocella silvestris BL2]